MGCSTGISLIVSMESAINKRSKFGDRVFRVFIIKKKNPLSITVCIISLTWSCFRYKYLQYVKDEISFLSLRGISQSVKRKNLPNTTSISYREMKQISHDFAVTHFHKSVETLFCGLTVYDKWIYTAFHCMWGMSFRWWFIDFHEIHTNKQKRRILTLSHSGLLIHFQRGGGINILLCMKYSQIF